MHQNLEQKQPLARNQSAPIAIKDIAPEDDDEEEDAWHPRQDAAALQAQMLAMQQRLRATASGAQPPVLAPGQNHLNPKPTVKWRVGIESLSLSRCAFSVFLLSVL